MSHGAYRLIMWTFWASLVHTPYNRINPLPVIFLSTLNLLSLHKHNKPPAVFFAGCISQQTSSPPHRTWHVFLSIYSLFVSWRQSRSTLCFLTNLLIVLHLTPLLSPLTLYERIFMRPHSCYPTSLPLSNLCPPYHKNFWWCCGDPCRRLPPVA